MTFVMLIICSYLLGSVPFGVIIARSHGIDLRKVGSGNIGATNLSRAMGKKWAYFCFVLDVCKGLVPMLVTMRLISHQPGTAELFGWLAVGVAAVLGHVFPIYIGFKGGKGVATSFGVALGLWPYFTIAAAAAFVAWVFCVLIWKYVSLGSIIGSLVFPVSLAAAIAIVPEWTSTNLWPLFIVGILIPVMVTVKHRDNIKRILAGTESKVMQKKV